MSIPPSSTSLPRPPARPRLGGGEQLPAVDERVLGELRGGRPGRTVLAIGGIHGNEPAGIAAAERVLRELEPHVQRLSGRFVAATGNLGALARGRRFLHHDLNRLWAPDQVRARRAGEVDPKVSEEREQAELLEVLDRLEREDDEGLFVVDLHSSSAGGHPFAFVGDTLRDRPVALGLGVPVIFGVEDAIHGSLLEHVLERGLGAVAIEGGQHDDPQTIDRHEAGLWQVLWHTGVAPRDLGPTAEELARMHAGESQERPRAVFVVHRHGIAPGDHFQMEPGFRNFDPVRRGDLLAHDASGEIRAPRDALLLLPLYQGEGDDGFFLAVHVTNTWLATSALARRLGGAALALRWSGARPVRGEPGLYELGERRVPSWVWRLLGFRRTETAEGAPAVERRPERPR